MVTILEKLKTQLEVDLEETVFDDQLLNSINGGISYLKNNNIPISIIDKKTTTLGLKPEDEFVALEYLSYFVLQRFDRSLMQITAQTTQQWLEVHMQDLLYQLKTRYDVEKPSENK